MMQLIFYFVVVLHLTCGIRITVKECPFTKTTWQAREQEFECTPEDVYHCIQDDHGNLMETCMTLFHIYPSIKGGCPWAFHTESGRTILGGVFNPCSGPGCPKKTDPDYWTNQLYKYPICLHHYAQRILPVTRSTTSLSNITDTPLSPEISHKREENKNDLSTILGMVAGMVGVAVFIIAALCWYRRKRWKGHFYRGIEEGDPDIELDTKHLENKLIEVYQNATGCIPVIPLGGKTMPLSQFFSPVVVAQDITSKHREKKEKVIEKQTVETTADIFFNEDKPVKRIFMKGEAGRGKTVFSLKLLEEWCKLKQAKQSDIQEVLSQFKFIFHIAMRYVKVNRTRVMDMICDSVSNGDPRLMESIRYVLCNNDIRCLVVLDGLDEWTSNSDDFPDTYGLVNCVIFTSLRPWKLEKLQIHYTAQDKVVEILGIDPDSIDALIECTIKNLYGMDDQELTNRLTNYCVDRSLEFDMEELIQLPLILTAFCIAWCEEETSNLETGLEEKSWTYSLFEILHMLIQRAEKNNNEVKDYLRKHCDEQADLKPAVNTMPSVLPEKFPKIVEFQNILNPFCKLAYDDLMSNQTRLVFEKDSLERNMGRSTVELALKVGFISQCQAPGFYNTQKVSVSFFHKLIQELMAAMHISRTPNLIQTFVNQLNSIDKVMEFSNVVMFLTWLDCSLLCELSQQVGSMAERDEKIIIWRETLNVEYIDKVWSLYQRQCEWFSDMVLAKTVLGITIPTIYHVSDVCLEHNNRETGLKLATESIVHTSNTVVSLYLRRVSNISSIIQCLPQHSTSLTALYIVMCDQQDNEMLAAVLPKLEELTCIVYGGSNKTCDVNVVEALTKMSRLKSVRLWYITLRDTPMIVSHMTLLEKLTLFHVNMSAGSWEKFVSSLLDNQNKVHVTLEYTDIDVALITLIHSLQHCTIIREENIFNGYKVWLEFYKNINHTQLSLTNK